MTIMPRDVALYTIDTLPVQEHLGLVTFWVRDQSLDVAEQRALAGLRERAAALGADAVIGVRITVENEMAVVSESPRGMSQVLVSSVSAYLVHVSGSAAVRA